MSAVAPITDTAEATPALHLAAAPAASPKHEQDAEMYRWMLWFGVPVLIMSIFVGASFALDAAWLLGGAILFLVVDICILIWLCMSSDTNGVLGAAPAAH
jgi:hypothetical protein